MPAWRPPDAPVGIAVPRTGDELAGLLGLLTLLFGAPYGRAELVADLAVLGHTVTVRSVSLCLRYGLPLPRRLAEALPPLCLFVSITGRRPPPPRSRS